MQEDAISFFVAMQVPTKTHQQKKVSAVGGKVKFYEPPELAAVRAKYEAEFAKYRPSEPMTGPIELRTMWLYQSKTRDDGEWKTSKPDTDNLIKLPKDVMTKLKFWKDDAQVASETIQKRWTRNVPGVYVTITKLGRQSHDG